MIRTGRFPLHETHFKGRKNSNCEASLSFPETHNMFNDLKLSLWHPRACYFPDLTQPSLILSCLSFKSLISIKLKASVSQLGKLSIANREKKRKGSNTILAAIFSVFPFLNMSITFSQTLDPTRNNIRSLF